MSWPGGEAYLELRARYLQLLVELRRTRDHNPETLEAFEQILGPENGKSDLSRAFVLSVIPKPMSDSRQQQAAA